LQRVHAAILRHCGNATSATGQGAWRVVSHNTKISIVLTAARYEKRVRHRHQQLLRELQRHRGNLDYISIVGTYAQVGGLLLYVVNNSDSGSSGDRTFGNSSVVVVHFKVAATEAATLFFCGAATRCALPHLQARHICGGEYSHRAHLLS